MAGTGQASRVPRLTVVCGYPPNQAFGGGIILHSLLQDYPLDRLTVVTSGAALRALPGDPRTLLPCRHVPVEPITFQVRGIRRLGRALNTTRVVPAAAVIARHASGGTILAVPWGGLLGSELFAAAYVAHRRTRARLVVYELDEWRASIGGERALTVNLLERYFHPRLVRASSATFAVSEQLAQSLQQRFGHEVGVLPSPVDVADRPPSGRTAPRTGPLRILYTGAVYGAQADAIATVSQAVETLPGDAELVLHTAESDQDLRRFGIAGARTKVKPLVARTEVPDVLAGADVLLLPMSFRRDQREVVATSLPTKTADYLASGVPILVHAPAYSTVAELARRHGCAEVVDTPDPAAVRQSLLALRDDPRRAQELAGAAWRLARERHHAPVLRERLLRAICG